MSLTSTRDIRSKAWPEPIVHPDWYQNPSPIPNPALPANGNCNGCHVQGDDEAGPFPQISTATPGYCRKVLGIAVGQTMFPQDDAQAQYLFGLCKKDPDKGGLDLGFPVENPPGDDRGFWSPPIVASPLYEYVESVLVRGARVGSEVDLSVNGVVVATQFVENVDGVVFSINPLSAGDRVDAIQRFGNFSSLESPQVGVPTTPKIIQMVYLNPTFPETSMSVLNRLR